MAIVNGCCCWRNVRSGSFAAGFYILGLYTAILTGAVFQHFFNPSIHPSESQSSLIFTVVLIVFSVCCVISSVLLLVGLCVDSRTLMIPWIISVFSATLLDALGALYLIVDSNYHEYLIILFVFDIIILGLNVYSLLCVFSHFKNLCIGRGHPQVSINRSFLLEENPSDRSESSKKPPHVNDSGMTNSSTISGANSSAYVIQNDMLSESSFKLKNIEDTNFGDEVKFSDGHNNNMKKLQL